MRQIGFYFIVFFMMLINALDVYASDSLSYTGRLVNANGVPVTGPVNLKVDLAYTTAGGVGGVLCSKTMDNVELSNGVFHLKLDFSLAQCGNKKVAKVLSDAPPGETAAIRITDTTNSKVYSYHAIHSIPYASVSSYAKDLAQLGAQPGQALRWNGQNWGPYSVPGTGTVMSIQTGDGLVGGPITESGAISIAPEGVTGPMINRMGAFVGQVLKYTETGWQPRTESVTEVVEVDPHVRVFARKDATGVGPQMCYPHQSLNYNPILDSLYCQNIGINSDAAAEGAANLYFTDQRARDAVVSDVILDGVIDLAPSQNAVFDALATKEPNITPSSDILMRSLRLSSGANWLGFQAPSPLSGNVMWTLPLGDGASGDVLITDGGGNLRFGSASSLMSTLTRGDFLVGSNFNGSTPTTWSVDATKDNIPGKVVVRDELGNFSAGTITANLTGNASTATNATSATSATRLTTPRTINGVSFDGTANISISAPTPQILTNGSYLTGSNFNGATATTWAVDATVTNTANKIVARDGSGNFSAGTITANLNGNATTATSAGTATSAASATKLTTARTINGVAFDGTANITLTAASPATLSRGSYLTGSNYNGSAATTWAVDATSANSASKIIARDANGDFYSRYMRGTGFFYTSDKRLKKDIAPIDDSMEKIRKLQGVYFKWRKDSVRACGFIAQDVEKVVPELVDTNEEGMKSVQYGNITAILVEALKEQDDTIKQQQNRIENLEDRLKRLESIVSALEK